MEYRAEIYTKKTCKHCNLAKKLLAQHNIRYKELIINGDSHMLMENQQVTTRESLLERYPDARTVPQIWLDGQHIGGAEELEQYFAGVDRQENHQ